MALAIVAAAAPLAVLLTGCDSNSGLIPGGSGGECGTVGGGTVIAINQPSYTCTNCGTNPCVDSSGNCWSCFSPSTNQCYPYTCGDVCQSTPCSTPAPGTGGVCGIQGGGTVTSANMPSFTCTNCGSAPCVDSSFNCWSCYSPTTQQCYPYNCNGVCSSTACSSAYCGTIGGGTVKATNDPTYTCTNCGSAPCVDSSGNCWSCYLPTTQQCYPYYCNGVCQGTPCAYSDHANETLPEVAPAGIQNISAADTKPPSDLAVQQAMRASTAEQTV